MLDALSFSSPLILAALAALPAIWFLLRATPPTPANVRFPAFEILRSLTTKEETPDRTPWPLILLRLLIAALVIVALAGPILNAPPDAAPRTPILLVVDDTFAGAANWNARRTAMIDAAENAAANDREVFIATTAPRPAPSPWATLVGPLTGAEARERAASLAPTPLGADRESAMEKIAAFSESAGGGNDAEIRWLADGVAGAGDAAFANALAGLGDLTVNLDAGDGAVVLRPLGDRDGDASFKIERLAASAPLESELIALARDGRELTRVTLAIAASQRSGEISLDLPLALRNDLASVRLGAISSAGAVQLADARSRRALIGFIAEADQAGERLLSGGHYLRKALSPYAEFMEGGLDDLMNADISVMVLDDVGRLRAGDVEKLSAWMERGGVVIRFAGPDLAVAAQEGAPSLLPTPLRGGGRAFGGALTWETPQQLDAFAPSGPFANLPVPGDVYVKRQVLAQPGGDTTERTWARLKDGTPLVTGASIGDGALVLFHVTATPEWSDLPISGVFVDMLRRLTFLSALGPDSVEDGAATRYAPLRILDGFGQLQRPPDGAASVTMADLADDGANSALPGLYGPPEAPLAVNAVTARTPFEPLSVGGLKTARYSAAAPARIAPVLFAAALALFLIDALVALIISGRLRITPPRAGESVAALFAAFGLYVLLMSSFGASSAHAEPPATPLDETAVDAALETRLAYVLTGDPAIDRVSHQGLAALSRELVRRTSVEPGTPVGVDPEADDLSVYPFLYWPVTADAEATSETALSNIEEFMRFGGMVVFDTRDDERANAGAETPEGAALRVMLSQLDVPPLTPVDEAHVMARSFYILGDLWGRQRTRPVWVQTRSDSANDGVTPIVIGGRDWAASWATDEFGRPVKPVSRRNVNHTRKCTSDARECSYRAGVNIVMVALTGNYKFDQVHAPILIERLGE
ncbi:MAG: DUF4159 domain-containing protein [Pseudomonadota bacterium]